MEASMSFYDSSLCMAYDYVIHYQAEQRQLAAQHRLASLCRSRSAGALIEHAAWLVTSLIALALRLRSSRC
jgi:hypothetical protein